MHTALSTRPPQSNEITGHQQAELRQCRDLPRQSGYAPRIDNDRYNPRPASYPDRVLFHPGYLPQTPRDLYNQGSESQSDTGRYNQGSASHPVTGKYNPGPASHPITDRYNQGSASHPDRDRYNQGSASHPVTDRHNQGSASHPVTHRYNQGSASDPVTDRYNQGSASQPVTGRYNQGSAAHSDLGRYKQGSVSHSDRGRYDQGSPDSRKHAIHQPNWYRAQQPMPRRCHGNQPAKFPLREATFGCGPVADPRHPVPSPGHAHINQLGCGSQLYTSSHVKQCPTVPNNTVELCHQSPLMRGQPGEPHVAYSMYGCRPSRHNGSYSLTNCSSSQSPLSKSSYPESSPQPARCPFVSPVKHDLTASYLSPAATYENSDMSPVSNIRFNNQGPPSQYERTNLHLSYVIPYRPPHPQYSHIQWNSPWAPQCPYTRFELPLQQNMLPPDHRFPSHLKAATSQYSFEPFPDGLSTRPNLKQHPHTLPSRPTSLPTYTEVPSLQSGLPLFSRTSPSSNSLPPLNGRPLRPELPPGSIAPQCVLAPCPKRCFTNHYGYLDYCPVPDLPSYTPNSLWWEEQAAPTSRQSPADRRHRGHTNTVPDTGTRPHRDGGCSSDPGDVPSVGKRGGEVVREVICSKKMKVTQKSTPPSLLNQRRIKVLNKALGLARRSPKKPTRQSSVPSIETRGLKSPAIH
ncbi:uncharacterized protein LOC124256031 isoform X2 [Haliotis rubra]|uniref:uncharacterized protein LOC124256031 isoform X2 n=1 Tax=Haliotis rubra TaxID=36100 RepID=UPI001EE5EEDA|nr:uncharacterized protein LOC124256031 isoform X2 [Haliotis rubra]